MKIKLPFSLVALCFLATFVCISCGEKPQIVNENFKEKLIDEKLMDQLSATYSANNYCLSIRLAKMGEKILGNIGIL
mgnify:CR=1 FL=1